MKHYPTNPALEAAVIADAENDLPRLVYADWLEEQGDAHRANFIRAQCALYDKHPADPDYPDWTATVQESTLALAGRADLLPVLPAGFQFFSELHDCNDGVPSSFRKGIPGLSFEPATFQRGFPTYAWSTERGESAEQTKRLTHSLRELFSTTTVRGIFDLRDPRALLKFRRSLAPLAGLDLCNWLGPYESDVDIARAVVEAPIASKLRELRCRHFSSRSVVSTLANAPFRRLRRLWLGTGWLEDVEVTDALFRAEWMTGIQEFTSFIGNEHPQLGVSRAIAGLSQLPELHTLNLQQLIPSMADEFAKREGFANLARVRFLLPTARASGIAKALCKARFPRLSSLEIQGPINNEDLTTLTQSDWFGTLRDLRLEGQHSSEVKVSDKSILPIMKHPVAQSLRTLTLETRGLGAGALTALAVGLPNLTGLGFGDSGNPKITPAAMSRLLKTISSPHLRHLSIWGFQIGDAGAVAMAKNPAFGRLRLLDVRSCRIGVKGMQAILESPHLQGLISLRLGTPITTAEKRAKARFAEILKDPAVMPNLVLRD